MNRTRYRASIDKTKIINWRAGLGRGAGQWYSNYSPETGTVRALAKKIKLDLEKWCISESKHGSGLSPAERLVSPEKRGEIIRAALKLLL